MPEGWYEPRVPQPVELLIVQNARVFDPGAGLDQTADAVIDTNAFNQQIVQGANLQGNTVDMTVVGGNFTNTLTGEDDNDA